MKAEVAHLSQQHQAMAARMSAMPPPAPAPTPATPAPGPSRPQLPPASDLPEFDPSNPWRSALHSILRDGQFTVEGCGTRPLSDFEFFPTGQALPNCWVRLSETAAVRVDKVPKETVIFPRDRAQACFMKATKDQVENTHLTPESSNLVMFVRSMTGPYLTAPERYTSCNMRDITDGREYL